MILQYKGFNNNWTYEEANQITVSTAEVTIADIKANDAEEELNLIKKFSEQIEEEIISATHGINITYLTNKPIYKCGNVKVVILSDKNKEVTYVFDMEQEVYLLNDSGKTIRKV